MRDANFRRSRSLSSIFLLIGFAMLSLVPEGFTGMTGSVLAASDPVIAAAGDIACDPSSSSFNGGNGSSGSCRQKYTSDLLVNGGFAAVLPLGDIQYYCGGYQAFLQSYDLSWGRVKSISRPAVGNHEYLTSGGTDCTSANAGAAGYFNYFGAAAGHPSQGYYSYNIGAWHLIALNSNCSSAGGCGSSSPQGLWLKADLAANPTLCTLAYWHIPVFSSGGRANNNARQLWQILYDHGVELALTGHDHIYERFAPQTSTGALDTARGIRSFIVGTGGSNHTSLASIAANSELRNTDTFGILKLTLHPTSYDWQFVPEAGKTFTDSGSANCFGSGQPGITNTPGATSAPFPSATNTPASTQVDTQPTSTFTFSPIADSYVNQSSAGTNYGTSTQLRTDGSPLVRGYMRFAVSNLAGRITRATLRVYANSALSLGYDVRAVTDNTWGETTINYNNAPAFGNAIGLSGPVIAGGWTNIDLTPLITGNGTYNIALTSSSGTALSLASREASAANRPQLIVEVTDPTATPNPTQTATASLTSTLTFTPSQTATPTVTDTRAATQTLSDTATATQTATDPPTETLTPVEPFTDTPAPTETATLTDPPSDTPTVTETETPVPTAIDPPNETPTATASPVQTQADTETATPGNPATDTPIPTVTDTETPVVTDTPTSQSAETATDTPVPVDTETSSPTDTETPALTDTPTDTPVPADTITPSPTATILPSPTATDVPVPTLTNTPTSTPVPSNTPAISAFTFVPVEDAYVNQSNPTTIYGASSQVRVDGSPLVWSYLRFNIQNLTGNVTRVTLRIYANSRSSTGFDVRPVTGSWSETSINYNNAPPFGSVVSSSGPFSGGQWTTLDITSLVTGNGTCDIALTTSSSTAVSLASSEAGANAPQLIIETAP